MKAAPLLFLVIVALTPCAGAAVAAWTRVADSDEAAVYADTVTIKRTRQFATMWHVNDLKSARQTLVTMSAGQVYWSTKVHQEFDCRAAKMRTLSFAAHRDAMGNGDVVLADNSVAQWSAISAGEVGAILFKMACGKPLP
jgi:hypothetical protein